MNNYQPSFGQSTVPTQFAPYQQIQQMFPQPQGSVYQINSPTEIGNVPIGSTGLSVAICFQEQIMYIKSFQNGTPIIMAYRILPYTKEESQPNTQNAAAPSTEERLAKIETLLSNLNNTNEGGKFNGLL